MGTSTYVEAGALRINPKLKAATIAELRNADFGDCPRTDFGNSFSKPFGKLDRQRMGGNIRKLRFGAQERTRTSTACATGT